jgi:predicted dehydrogenase
MALEGFHEIDYGPIEGEKIGVGILGYGFMGKTHSNAFLKIPFLHGAPPAYPELVALCGRDRAKVEETGRVFKYKGFYTDWHHLVEDPRVAIFDNCTPDNLHYEPSIAAAKNGKHVICEKPLSMTVDEAREMADAVETAKIKHMCCFNYRFIPAVRLARQLIEQEALGQIYQFRAQYLQEPGHDPKEVVENVWYASGTRSGVLLGIGSHIIDMARFLVGEIGAVSGLMKTFNTSRKTASGESEEVRADECNMALVEFENGVVGTLESSGISTGRKNQHTWEINGSKGSIAFDLEDLNRLHVYLAEGSVKEAVGFANVSVTQPFHPLRTSILPPGHNAGWEYGHVHALNHFVRCIVEDKPVEPYGATFEDGYRVQVIMDAIQESSRVGRRIEIEY